MPVAAPSFKTVAEVEGVQSSHSTTKAWKSTKPDWIVFPQPHIVSQVSLSFFVSLVSFVVMGLEAPQDRVRQKDRGKALSGKSTLNRLELTPADADARARYKKIVADEEAIEDYFVDEYVRRLPKETVRVTLDLEATDDPIHGQQEGRFFHGYYGEYCYVPLYIFDGDWPVLAWLRTSDRDASAGAVPKVQKIVTALRRRFRALDIRLRADSGFCRDELMVWCELNGVNYLLGLARNAVLERKLGPALQQAKALSEAQGGTAARVFMEMTYQAQSWPAPGG